MENKRAHEDTAVSAPHVYPMAKAGKWTIRLVSILGICVSFWLAVFGVNRAFITAMLVGYAYTFGIAVFCLWLLIIGEQIITILYSDRIGCRYFLRMRYMDRSEISSYKIIQKRTTQEVKIYSKKDAKPMSAFAYTADDYFWRWFDGIPKL